MSGKATLFLENLKSAGRLPTPPGVVAQLLEATNCGDVTAKDIARIISGDPAMAAKVLRFVNSPMAGLQREVTSLQQAVALLGLNSVKMMALSFAVVAPADKMKCAGFGATQFAALSAGCGAAARHLSELLQIAAPQDAYTAGLLSQYGRFIFAASCPDEYARVLRQAKRIPQDLVALEQTAFDSSYPEVGAQLLRSWGLPESLCEAIATFRQDASHEGVSPLASIIALAEHAAEIVCPSNMGDAAAPEKFLESAKACFELSPENCTAALAAIAEETRQTCQLLDVPVNQVRSLDEVKTEVSDRITELSMALHIKNQELVRQQQDLHRRATTDALTGVGNRAAFDARLELELERSRRSGAGFALLMMDVDKFKSFNDTHGHQAGDEVLKVVATALDDSVRKVDYVARYGGEEFGVIAPDATPDGVAFLAERLRSVIAQTAVPWDGQNLSVTISIGICVYSDMPRDALPADTIRLADQQLYAAKCGGRDCVRICLNGEAVAVTAHTG